MLNASPSAQIVAMAAAASVFLRAARRSVVSCCRFLPLSYATLGYSPASLFAARKTSSNIFSVSFPVEVFCWLG